MKHSLLILMLSALLFIASGCTYWYQEGKSFNDCEQDLQQCYQEMKKYADTNDIGSYEINFVKDCMKEKGYKLVTEDKLPKNVKREDPQLNTFWLLAGKSGTIEK